MHSLHLLEKEFFISNVFHSNKDEGSHWTPGGVEEPWLLVVPGDHVTMANGGREEGVDHLPVVISLIFFVLSIH